MTSAVKISSVTANIAAQSITVTNVQGASVTLGIRDTSNIPEAVNQEMCPILIPRPANFLTEFQLTRDTFGADAALKTVKYVLNYIFYYAPVGQGSTIFSKFDEMVVAAAVTINHFATNTNAICQTNSAATEFLPQDIPAFDPVQDKIGTLFHGCVMSFYLEQFLEI